MGAQIYQLLVSILPSLAPALALPLLEAVRESLETPVAAGGGCGAADARGANDGEGGARGDHFFEVSEFCCAIAEQRLAEGGCPDAGAAPAEESRGEAAVREAVLSLQWAVFSHRQARTLKSYESLKRHVGAEIRNWRERENHLPTLFYLDLISYMKRRGRALTTASVPARKVCGSCNALCLPCVRLSHTCMLVRFNSPLVHRKQSVSSAAFAASEFNHFQSLTTRLQILRFVYGLLPVMDADDPFYEDHDAHARKLSTEDLDLLWNLCAAPADREVLLTFLANASRRDGLGGSNVRALRAENSMHNVLELEPAFSENEHVFEHLLCSRHVGWEDLGEAAYRSFREFDARGARDSPGTTDALWRICLTAGDTGVAGRAMSDLLAVYNSPSGCKTEIGEDGTIRVIKDGRAGGDGASKGQQFSHRIFDCLVQVEEGLRRGDRSSERGAERCVRILSAAIEQCHSLGGSAGAVAKRLAAR